MEKKPVCITIEKEILEKIDEQKGDISRSKYIERLILEGLNPSQPVGGDSNV